eukprot:c44819_g1_i1 orf=1-171(-)
MHARRPFYVSISIKQGQSVCDLFWALKMNNSSSVITNYRTPLLSFAIFSGCFNSFSS